MSSRRTVSVEVAELVDRYRLAEARLLRRRQNAPGLSPTDRAALDSITARHDAGAPATPKIVAAHVGITSASTAVLINRLEAAHLLTRVPSEVDKRSTLLTPTHPDGAVAAPDALVERVASLAAALSPSEARTVGRFLEDLTDLIEDEMSTL